MQLVPAAVLRATLAVLIAANVAASQPDAANKDSVTAKRKLAAPFRWKTTGSQYMDPTSFFSLHGYVDAVFAGASRDWTAADPASPGMPGQVLIPNTPRASFQYDGALFVGAEVTERSRLMMEWHLVSDPGGRGAAGPGGNTIVMTEATATWDLVAQYLSMSAGLYWAPFATVNKEWLGAQNLFTVVPVASAAFPAHFNERGVRFDGARAFNADAAINYVLSIGNGVSNFDISGQESYDRNDGKTTMARVGVFPGLGKSLEFGGSVAAGALRDHADSSRTRGDPERYAADFQALGLDAAFHRGAWSARSYVVTSTEQFGGSLRASGTPASLARRGGMLELSYNMPVSTLPFGITHVTPKARIDLSRVDGLNASGNGATSYHTRILSLGSSIAQTKQMLVSIEYHIRREGARAPLANDRLVLRMTAEF